MTDGVASLCAHVGVKPDYRGFDGQTITVSPETRLAVLNAMGLEIATDADAHDRVAEMQRDAQARPLPQEVIVEVGQTAQLDLPTTAEWRIEAETTAEILAEGHSAGQITLPPLPLGIHCLIVTVKGAEFTTYILARPARATGLAERTARDRIWGVTTALYGLTDGGKTALGDYPLLGKYAAAIAIHGADFIGVNPIHAMGATRPDDVISPYSPSHRGFLNTWHIAGEPTPTQSDLIDYSAALKANAATLAASYAAFAKAPKPKGFSAFVETAGEPLQDYALFEALSAQLGPDWRDWPAPYRTHDEATLAAFRNQNRAALNAAIWAQWQADTQLSQAQTQAKQAGMGIGLYLDLAVGPRLGGAETWAKGATLITGATLGAPPDPLGPNGQSWGLAPQSPVRCRDNGYEGFANLLRAVMRHAGMIRIDHVLGLMRCFWIPEGREDGAYVDYPFDALLAVVAIESARSGTIVIGEDLGLVPAGLREKLAASGIYGLDVLQYMRADTGGFVDAADTRKLAACAFATHDTPTIKGFFHAADARQRHSFGALDDSTLAETIADRDIAKNTLTGANPVAEIHHTLAKANAAIVAIQLDDIAESETQQNLPGTIDEYPNWRQPAPFSVHDIETSTDFARLGAEMHAAGRANAKPTDPAT